MNNLFKITKKEGVLSAALLVVALAAGVALLGPKSSKGPVQLTYPRGLSVDAVGKYFYVANSRAHDILKYRTSDIKLDDDFGEFGRVENGDPKRLAAEMLCKFNEPNGVAVGPDGLLYVVDTWNSRIQVLDPKNGKVKKVITSDDGFFGPRELVVDKDGSVYVADTGRHRIVKFGVKGERIRVLGSPKGKGDGDGEFNEPIGLALDPAGNLYVADRLNFRIEVFDSNGHYLRKFKVKGWEADQIDMEPHLALDAARGVLYASDGRGHRILRFTLDGKQGDSIEKGSDGFPLKAPIGIAVDSTGDLYVSDAGANKVMRLKP